MAPPTWVIENMRKQRLNELRYRVKEYFANNPLPPVPYPDVYAGNLELPTFANLSHEQCLQERNGTLTRNCRNRKLDISNVAQLPPVVVKKTKRGPVNPYEVENIISLVDRWDDLSLAVQRKMVFQDTSRKLLESRGSPSNVKEFCYWRFQNSLKLRAILKEISWLKNRISGDDTYVNHSAVLKFEDIYGPIHRKEDGMILLKNFRKNLINAQKIGRKTEILLKFFQKFGKAATLKALKDMEAFALELLKLPGDSPGYSLLEQAKDRNSILNVDPLTNSSQTEWFHLKRFEKPVGPSNLFVHHEKLNEFGLVDYQLSPRRAAVTGLCISFIDTIFKYPVKRSRNPLRRSTDKWARMNIWNKIYNAFRLEISLYTCGVEIGLFLKRLKQVHLFLDENFENMSDEKVVGSVPELVIVTELPGTKAKILFPRFMKFILPLEDMEFGLLMVLERFWRRTVFLVRVSGGFMRNMDFKWQYWNFFKKGIVVQDWGFKGMDEFVEWCNKQWNPDRKHECIVVERHSGSNDLFLVYKPGNKEIW